MANDEKICSTLAASLCAYGIDKKGGVTGEKVAADVGFIGSPKTFTARGIDACYVADTADHVILAFRGTLSSIEDIEESELLAQLKKIILDIFNDLLAKPAECSDIAPGKLHSGFHKSMEMLWATEFHQEVKSRMASGKPLVITGHSKGAALASIAAALLHKRLNMNPERMHIRCFESPRPGDALFADHYNRTFKNSLHYAYQDDIIPWLPPMYPIPQLLKLLVDLIPGLEDLLNADFSNWYYASVGNSQFVNWDKKVVAGNNIRVVMRRLEHMRELIEKAADEEDITVLAKCFTDHTACRGLYKVLCDHECGQRA